MRVLIACEESQAVTIAFRELGHEAYSCDIQECSGGHPEWHIKGDVIPLLNEKWDMLIAHPPCTYLSNAGIGWFNEEKYGDKARLRKELREEALQFFLKFANCGIPKICIENPTGYANSHFRKPDQTIQPWMFGDPESKRTCLWLTGLPKLQATDIVSPRVHAYYKNGKKKGQPIYWSSYMMFGEERAKARSKTFPGIAKAMAQQWSPPCSPTLPAPDKGDSPAFQPLSTPKVDSDLGNESQPALCG